MNIFKKFIIIFCFFLTINFVSSWDYCYLEGYQQCINKTITTNDGLNILSAKIAISLIDGRGFDYSQFQGSSWAVKGLYAHIYYEGDELWYTKNINNWSNVCNNNNCSGLLFNNSGYYKLNNSGYYQLATIGDEYVDCPGFTSVYLHPTGYVWVSAGYKMPINNTCCHIRVTECILDNDCILYKEYCKREGLNWQNWSCQQKNINTLISTNIPVIDLAKDIGNIPSSIMYIGLISPIKNNCKDVQNMVFIAFILLSFIIIIVAGFTIINFNDNILIIIVSLIGSSICLFIGYIIIVTVQNAIC